MSKYLCRIADDPDTDMEIEAAYHWEAAELFLEKYNECDPPKRGGQRAR